MIVEPVSAFLIMISCILLLSDWIAFLSAGVRLLEIGNPGVEHVVLRAISVSTRYFSNVLLVDVVGM